MADSYASLGTWSYAPPAGGIAGTSTAVTVQAAHPDPRVSIAVDSMQIDASSNTAVEFTIQDANSVILHRAAIPTTGKNAGLYIFAQPLIATKGFAVQIKSSGTFTGNAYANLQGRFIIK